MLGIPIKRIARLLASFQRDAEVIKREIEMTRVAAVQQRVRELARIQLDDIRKAELRVFSQWGEDGIIQYLISHIDVEDQTFVEFGVEDYQEANTRFLLVNNNWRGLVLDSNRHYIETIRSSELYWRQDLVADCAFITRENINGLLLERGITGDIGLLSVDIDGNDYWVWESIEVVRPRIVIVEYNSLFGPHSTLAVPYDPTFSRFDAHYSGLLWGASLNAFCYLAERKGYVFVGSNSAGSNAFFVRADVVGTVRKVSCEEGFVLSRFREARDVHGSLTFVGGDARRTLLHSIDFEVVDVSTGKRQSLRQIGSGRASDSEHRESLA